MTRLLEQRLRKIMDAGQAAMLRGGHKGLEKESLRIAADGSIATTPHPRAWGAPLTHPYITTDYSEALPEFVTPAFAAVSETIAFLDQLHRFAYSELADSELLWAASMPCAVADDSAIPIAEYGTSNIGRLKHIYRVGLDYRYGRRMQAIAGVHFNYSLPLAFWPLFQQMEDDGGEEQAFRDRSYFALIRNFKRLGWLVPFLFGTSPAVCKSFLAGRTTRFRELIRGTYYLPYATSLRMSDIGYKNKNQSALLVSYDNLDAYLESLQRALRTPYPEYEAIGVRDGDEYIQLNTNVLQIENEYYSFVRPKRTTEAGERPRHALRQRGVEYVEIRALDVNCLSPIGVAEDEMHFLEAFLIFCLLEQSPPLTEEELRAIEYNELTVALRGRTPGLELMDARTRRGIRAWSLEICDRMQPICECLDMDTGQSTYRDALTRQMDAIRSPEDLPSARILQTLSDGGLQFHNYMMSLSTDYARDLRARALEPNASAELAALAARSHEEQRTLEARDDVPLDQFIAAYIAD